MGFTTNQLVIFAARSGNLTLLSQRVRAGGDINYFDPLHGSALAAVIRNGNLAVLEWLISKEVDLNAEYHDGIGPLEIALSNPVYDVVYRLVCAGAKLRKKTRPHYRERLEQCLAEASSAKPAED